MTRPNTVMSASEDRMTDLIDRLTLYEHRAGYDGKDWEKIASEAAETLRALSAAPRPIGEGDAWARCQKCGGEIEGWICQSCDQGFRENDAGDLIFDQYAAQPAPSADSGGELSLIDQDTVAWFADFVDQQAGEGHPETLGLIAVNDLLKALAQPADGGSSNEGAGT